MVLNFFKDTVKDIVKNVPTIYYAVAIIGLILLILSIICIKSSITRKRSKRVVLELLKNTSSPFVFLEAKVMKNKLRVMYLLRPVAFLKKSKLRAYFTHKRGKLHPMLTKYVTVEQCDQLLDDIYVQANNNTTISCQCNVNTHLGEEKNIFLYGVVTKSKSKSVRVTLSLVFSQHFIKQVMQDAFGYKNTLNALESKISFQYLIAADRLELFLIDVDGNTKQIQFENYLKRVKAKELVHEDDVDTLTEVLYGEVDNARRVRMTLDPNLVNTFFHYDITANVTRDYMGRKLSISGFFIDVEMLVIAEEIIFGKAEESIENKLYSKSTLIQKVEVYLKENETTARSALLMINLDHIRKTPTDKKNTVTNAMIEKFVSFLQSLSDDMIVGFHGDDEFILFMKSYSSIKEIERISEKILTYSFGEKRNGNKSQVNASVGISLYPEHGTSYKKLINRAENALFYVNNTRLKNQYKIYTEDLEDKVKNRIVSSSTDDEIEGKLSTLVYDMLRVYHTPENTIKMILEIVGGFFDADVAMFASLNHETHSIIIDQYWSKHNQFVLQDRFINQTTKEWKQYLKKYDARGIYRYSGEEDVQNDFQKLYTNIRSKDVVHAIIYENGIEKKALILSSSTKRKCTDEKLNVIAESTKKVSSLISKVTLLAEMNSTVHSLTMYDKITRLYSFEHFIKLGREYIASHDTELVAIYSDIHGFRFFNEKYGYAEGDKILQKFAEHISNTEKFWTISARINADHFVSLVEVTDIDSTTLLSGIKGVNQTVAKEIQELYPGSVITIRSGVYMLESGDDVTLAIDNANLARKYIKTSNLDAPHFYKKSLKEEATKVIEIQSSMHKALANQEFIVHYQPKYDLRDHKLIGAEALIRWRKSNGTYIFPNDFIPIFEETHFITEVDLYVLEHVCKLLKRQMEGKEVVVPISVNFSRIDLEHPEFQSRFQAILEKYKVPVNLIEIEITESVFLDNQEEMIARVNRLKDLGAIIAIDDFGAGYSSLNILRNIRADVLKLDKTFLDVAGEDILDDIMIRSVVDLGKKLGMTVVAEGVETLEQALYLSKIGCDIAQGYYFSKPLEKSMFLKELDLLKG